MRIGLALPHYDFSVPGENPLRWETVLGCARRAEALGFDSLWVSDHLFLDIEKYGGAPGRYGAFEAVVTLSALARATSRSRLGTLVFCCALRPPGVLAKQLATLDQMSGGRLEVGLGAGWYEPEFREVGLVLPSPSERLARLEEALDVVLGLLGGGPFTYTGRHHRVSEAINRPPARQSPRPPVLLGGKGDRLLALVAEKADGWNTAWVWTPEEYRERHDALERQCEKVGRDPTTVRRSLGLYVLVGEDARDLERRWERMRALAPPDVLTDVDLGDWRRGRLVGTVDEVREQVAGWADLGVDEIIVSAGPLPFSLASSPSDADDLDLVAEALVDRVSNTSAGG